MTMSKRGRIGLGLLPGLVWSGAIVAWPQTMAQPFMPINVAVITALLPGGLVMLLLVARLALRWYGDDAALEGGLFPSDPGGHVDQRVLTATAEQMVLNLVLWPFVALTLGALIVLWMGVGFAIARVAYWAGSHYALPLRVFGSCASFCPTVFATFWAVAKWAF